MSESAKTVTGERADLLETLGKHRFFLRYTAQNLSDEQASATPTASALSVGGLIKHVTATEKQWMRFAVDGASGMAGDGGEVDWADGFKMTAGETVEGLLKSYDEVARHTDDLLATLDLDSAHPLPEAPWFEPGARWSVRRVALHLIAETSQHAGHADIIRETLDGQRTMG
ncbi:DinB family protein [Catellatospora methionotrophica]|uniref:DinB family protein n=1 Tax=Catellatospora methionotrophica TaxID=121620 RepID=UPI0033FD4FE9